MGQLKTTYLGVYSSYTYCKTRVNYSKKKNQKGRLTRNLRLLSRIDTACVTVQIIPSFSNGTQSDLVIIELYLARKSAVVLLFGWLLFVFFLVLLCNYLIFAVNLLAIL